MSGGEEGTPPRTSSTSRRLQSPLGRGFGLAPRYDASLNPTVQSPRQAPDEGRQRVFVCVWVGRGDLGQRAGWRGDFIGKPGRAPHTRLQAPQPFSDSTQPPGATSSSAPLYPGVTTGQVCNWGSGDGPAGSHFVGSRRWGFLRGSETLGSSPPGQIRPSQPVLGHCS